MKTVSRFSSFSDPQNLPPAAHCDLCKGEIYAEDLVHVIHGSVICPECFDDFVFSYFAHCLTLGKDIANLSQQGAPIQ